MADLIYTAHASHDGFVEDDRYAQDAAAIVDATRQTYRDANSQQRLRHEIVSGGHALTPARSRSITAYLLRMTGVNGDFPTGHGDDRELYLAWLGYLRGAVLRKLHGLTDDQARWRPEGALVSVLGIVNHLTHVEWRWIDGGIRGADVSRSEQEFHPGPELTAAAAEAAYRERAITTDQVVRSLPLDTPCRIEAGTDLRWVLLHLINETARHAGHADATRELLDGTIGE